ncbi:MAG: glycosyltransferase [Cellvibrionaceae bacterium]|nr:glycosyltransferase [Cellvibrionaceae bacterium]
MSIDMLVFGEDWGQHPSSTQHLIKQMLHEQEIVWVNSLGLRRPRLNSRDLKRAWHKLWALREKRPIHPATLTPHLVNPLALPFPGSATARRVNSQLLTHTLAPVIGQSRGHLLWTSLPSAVDVVGKLGERATVYYCGDDFAALDGVDHEPVAQMEQELAAKSQLIIAASSKLAQKFPAYKTMTLPHGVDYDLFATPCDAASDLPTGPVAGFYGAIAGWFDQQLMVATARKLPHWKFILIGPASVDTSALSAEPNIQLLGPKPHDELPHYSQHWDAGLLPFKDNQQIAACNPLKLREYLAAGSPVVTTEFPALEGYRDLVHTGKSASDFAQALNNIHDQHHYQQVTRQQRQARVQSESWTRRADELKDILRAL